MSIVNWTDVIGQNDVKERLLKMVEDGRVPHAVMLCGPQGCGKMALAMAFASTLLRQGNENANTEAMLEKMEHPDLHFTFPTIKGPGMGSEHQPVSDDYIREWRELIAQGPYFTMDQWMSAMNAANQQAIITGAESDELSRRLSLKSSQGGYKVSIIWLPERMNATSANKLLKLLEEPPQQTVFIMVSENPDTLLDTIRSRTQRIDVKRIDVESIEQALVERRGIEPDMAHRLARAANGNWTNAIEALNTDNENRMFLDMFKTLMRQAFLKNVKELKRWSETVASYGRERQKRMLVYFMQMVRENFVYNFKNPELNYMTQDEEDFSRNFSRFINETNVVEMFELMQKAHRDIGQNTSAKVVFYELALQIIVLIMRK